MEHPTSKVLSIGERWRHFLTRGLRLLGDGKHIPAAEAFEMAFKEAPDEPQVQLAVGREWMRQGRFVEAEDVLRAAHRSMPGSAAAAAALSRLLGLHLDKLEEAFQIIDHAIRKCEAPATLQVIRGELLLEAGAYLEARSAFSHGVEDPMTTGSAEVGLSRTFNAEGIDLSEQGKYETAVFAFKRAADLEPEWAGPHVNMGVVFGCLNKPVKSMEAYAAALQRDPTNPVAHFNLGTVQQKLGLHEAAVSSFEQLLEIAPEYPSVRGALANVLGELKEFDRAIALLLEELEIDATDVGCWSSLGLAYICTGNPDRGEQCLLRALELDPEYFNTIHNLASLYITQGRLEEAEEILRQAHRLDPDQTSSLVASDSSFDSVRDLEQFHFLKPPLRDGLDV